MHSPGDTRNNFVLEIPEDFSLDLPNIYSAEALILPHVFLVWIEKDIILTDSCLFIYFLYWLPLKQGPTWPASYNTPSEHTTLMNIIIPGFYRASTSYLTLVHAKIISMKLLTWYYIDLHFDSLHKSWLETVVAGCATEWMRTQTLNEADLRQITQ